MPHNQCHSYWARRELFEYWRIKREQLGWQLLIRKESPDGWVRSAWRTDEVCPAAPPQ